MRSASLVLGVSLIMGTASSIEAQGAAPESVTKGFAQVADWITQSAESVPAEKYSFKPTDGVRTFGQLVAHIVDGYRFYCRLAKGPVEWTDTVEKTVPPRRISSSSWRRPPPSASRSRGSSIP